VSSANVTACQRWIAARAMCACVQRGISSPRLEAMGAQELEPRSLESAAFPSLRAPPEGGRHSLRCLRRLLEEDRTAMASQLRRGL